MTDDRTLALQDHYGAAARRAANTAASAISAAGECGIGASHYDSADLAMLPAEAVAGSIGCANPIALADLHPGEVVLDLGSGGGIDVLLVVAREAGARVVDRDGSEYTTDSAVTIAASPGLCDELVAIVDDALTRA